MNREQIKEEIMNVLTVKELYYYKMIDNYYKTCDKTKIETMVSIIIGESRVSLRILDWFVTRYSSKYKISYHNSHDYEPEHVFNVHISYKAQLKSYKKRYFDPFRRRRKFPYNYDRSDKTKILHTTIGQLNFFKWALSNCIIEYVENNYDVITKAMIIANKNDKEIKKEKKALSNNSNSDDNTNINISKSNISKKNLQQINVHINPNDNNNNNKSMELKIIVQFD